MIKDSLGTYGDQWTETPSETLRKLKGWTKESFDTWKDNGKTFQTAKHSKTATLV